MALKRDVFSADVRSSPNENQVSLWNQSRALYCQEPEKNGVHAANRVYSDVYVFDDDVDVPRKINASGQKHRLN